MSTRAGTLFIGNSVTAQKHGYVTAVEPFVSASGFAPVLNRSLGGVGSIGLLALADDVLGDVTAVVGVLETSASDAAGATSVADLPWVIERLCARLRERCDRLVALHLPRFDVDPHRHAQVVAFQNEAFDRLGIPVVDVCDAVGVDATSDGVHLTVDGAQSVASVLGPLLVTALASSQTSALLTESSDAARFVGIDEPAWRLPDVALSRFRMAVPTCRVGLGETATLDLAGAEPVSLVVIAGPTSGVVTMASTTTAASRQMWDAWCDFRRIQVAHIPSHLRATDRLTVGPSRDDTAVLDAWGQPTDVIRRGSIVEIVGMLVRDMPTGGGRP